MREIVGKTHKNSIENTIFAPNLQAHLCKRLEI